MEKFMELLEEYGLELDFMYGTAEEELYEVFVSITHIDDRKNAFDVLVDVLGEMMLKVKDYEKFSKKLRIPEQYEMLGSIVEKDLCVEIKKTPDGGYRTYLLNIEGEQLRVRLIRNVLLKNPEKLNVNACELKLKLMFDKKEALKGEIRKVLDLATELEKDRETKKKLNLFVQQIKERLEKIPSNPEWYLEYGSKNEMFKRLVDREALKSN